MKRVVATTMLIVLVLLGLLQWYLDAQHRFSILQLANVSLTFMAAFTAVFALVYGLRSAWHKNSIGKIFFVNKVVFSIVMIQLTISVWISRDYPGHDWARLFIYGGGALVSAAMLAALVHKQMVDRKRCARLKSVDEDED